MSKIFLSVVIPCYDEMANLQKGVLDKVHDFLEKKKFTHEIIVVDDGSKDGSVEFVKNFRKEHSDVRLIENAHFGKAGAVTTGMLSAAGEYVLFTDMDQATPIEELDKLLPHFKQRFDVVIGSRNNQRKGAPLIRKFISQSSIILRKFIVGINDIADTQCGFKMFTRKASYDLFSRIRSIHTGFHKIGGSNVTSGFDVELLYIATKMNLKIKEVPVSWLYVETRRVNPISDSLEGLVELIRIRKNAMNGKYNF